MTLAEWAAVAVFLIVTTIVTAVAVALFCLIDNLIDRIPTTDTEEDTL